MVEVPESGASHLSLSALSEMIRRALAVGVGGHYWVVGEVSDAKLNYSGHYYMELTERAQTGATLPLATARAVIWSRTYRLIEPYFRDVTGGGIAPGVQILFKCSVSFHPVYGMSLVVEDIDPTYTIGLAQRVRQQTINRLKTDGVFDMNRETEAPDVVQRVAVISSGTAAGYQDFMNELGASGFDFMVTLFQATMQGVGAVGSIIEALEAVASSDEEFEAVVVIRGGGSVSDLACFDDYELCANVAQFPLPIFSGIGHDKDISALDMVAHLSLKTPTAVAAHLVGRIAGFVQQIEYLGTQLKEVAQGQITGHGERLNRAANLLWQRVQGQLTASGTKLTTLEMVLKHSASNFVDANARKLTQLQESLQTIPGRNIETQMQKIDSLRLVLVQLATQTLNDRRHSIELLQAQITSANPRRILGMGYAIIRGVGGGTALKSISSVSTGEVLEIELADGTISSRVETTKKHLEKSRQ